MNSVKLLQIVDKNVNVSVKPKVFIKESEVGVGENAYVIIHFIHL